METGGEGEDEMRRTTLVLTFAVAVAMVVAVPAVGLAAVGDAGGVAQTNDTDTNDTDANATAPGERLSGVVGVGEAELEGDLDRRTFGVKVAQAASQEAQAEVVGDQLGDVEERLAELAQRKEELEAQREADEISEGKYRAEMAKVAAETRTAKQLTNQSEDVADELPADVLAERNVSADRIRTLRDRANELSGPEVAEIARGIAGPDAGQTPASDRPVEVPDRPERPGEDPADNRTGGDADSEQPADGTPDDGQADGRSDDGGSAGGQEGDSGQSDDY